MADSATKPFINRLALVFDFDSTLAPSSYERLLDALDVEPNEFFEQRIQPLLDDGWDSILARFYCIIDEAQRRDDIKLDDQLIREVGSSLELYAGVEDMFDLVRDCARDIVEDIEVEFYLLTAGILDLAAATSIAGEFDALWGGEFHCNEEGEALFAKQVITHPEKVRYIMQLAKGLSPHGPNGPSDVYRYVPAEEWHVPFTQIIYVGDGASDMPAFSLMEERDGIAIGVFNKDRADQWRGLEDVHPGREVLNLAPVDYAEDSELMQSLRYAVEAICNRVALRRLSQGE